jgi:hypothetical protein
MSKPVPKPSVTAGRTLGVNASTEVGVLLDPLQLEHYCQRIEDVDMPTLDEATFFTAALGVAASMLVAVVGVVIGTEKPSPYLIFVFLALFVGAAGSSYFYWRKYEDAKTNVGTKAQRIARELREVSATQRGIGV